MPKKAAAKSAPKAPSNVIRIRGARQNNLKGIDLDLPIGKLSVITGPSGSGKSSLAFDTIYAEGQRRYVETFSPYTRQFFERMDKPKVDSIEGIPPAIAIEQTNNVRSTRSTVGTITEINDYLKMIFPRLAEATCPECKRPVRPETAETIMRDLLAKHEGQTALIVFAIPVPAKTDAADFAEFLQGQGFLRIWLYGEVIRLDDKDALKGRKLPQRVFVVQDRVTLDKSSQARLSEAVAEHRAITEAIRRRKPVQAARLMRAIERVTADKALHTPDLGGKARTADVTKAVIASLMGDNG